MTKRGFNSMTSLGPFADSFARLSLKCVFRLGDTFDDNLSYVICSWADELSLFMLSLTTRANRRAAPKWRSRLPFVVLASLQGHWPLVDYFAARTLPALMVAVRYRDVGRIRNIVPHVGCPSMGQRVRLAVKYGFMDLVEEYVGKSWLLLDAAIDTAVTLEDKAILAQLMALYPGHEDVFERRIVINHMRKMMASLDEVQLESSIMV